MVTWVVLECSSPSPSCSNSLTSLLPNPYPPWWFPMGLQLIQLSEHTNTICLEMFFLNHAHNNLAAASRKHTFAKVHDKNLKREEIQPFPLQFLCFHFSFRFQIGHQTKPTGNIRALKMKTRERRKWQWMRGVKEGRIRKAKWWKGGRSSESPSEVVLGCNSALFSLQ